jgi:hypothetical protein
MLRSFAPKLKFQRNPDDRPVTQPSFETANYLELLRDQRSEEEELIAKLTIEVKENLSLAYESETRATFHHFLVGQKLVMLKERLDKFRFKQILTSFKMAEN